VGPELRHLEKRRSGVQKRVDTIARQQSAAGEMSSSGLIRAAAYVPGNLVAQISND
jgi:hypothetical protein